MSDDSDRIDNLIHTKIAPAAFELIERSTVPIFYHDLADNQIRRDRSGVLYRVGGRHFILTASHSLKEIASEGETHSFIYGGDGTKVIPFSELAIHGTETDGRDAAVIELTDEIASDLAPHRQFIGHSDIVLNDPCKSSLYAFFGYPASWTFLTDSGLHSVGFGLMTRRYFGKVSETQFHNPHVNLVVEMKDFCYRTDTKAREKFLPETMKGVSGGGIWRICDLADDTSIETWKPGRLALCAIQHRWHDNRDYAQGTWLDFALEIIQREYPDTYDAMKILYKKD